MYLEYGVVYNVEVRHAATACSKRDVALTRARRFVRTAGRKLALIARCDMAARSRRGASAQSKYQLSLKQSFNK